MEIIRSKNYQDMSHKAAAILAAQVVSDPRCVLGLATGGTPVGIYQKLVEWYKAGDVDFSGVTTVNLDEYRGIPKEHPQSYWSFMFENLFNHVNVNSDRIYLPNGTNMDAAAECARYDAVIDSVGGVDIQLLGIGNNGHIGFNEPGESFQLNTHCVDLSESTIEANKRFFEKREDVPKQAYSMGMKAIMQARKVLVVASGKIKAEAVKAICFGPVTPKVPGSILQLHPNCVLVGDEDALSLI